MKKIVIFIGGCKYNKGSEAMVRGCVKMLRKGEEDCNIILSSKDDISGKSINVPGVDRVQKRYTYNRSNKLIRYTVGVLRYIFHLKQITNWINHYPLLKECTDADLVIIMGGDNYDKAYHAFSDMHSMNITLKKIVKGKLIFLNASLNPEEINKKIIKDLTLFDYVTVREKITYEAIGSALDPMKLLYFPDIAFNLESETIQLSVLDKFNKILGINLSPLILSKEYTEKADEIKKAFVEIIDYAINKLEYQVILIPHVMNADLSILQEIYKDFSDSDRVFVVEDTTLNAGNLKYIISCCDLFLAARTHSTIAAYASYVPTMVLGYSVKSRGIARDLFDDEKYVVSVQKVLHKKDLVNIFKDFFEEKEQMKNHLREVIPDYLSRANQYKNFFQRILRDES